MLDRLIPIIYPLILFISWEVFIFKPRTFLIMFSIVTAFLVLSSLKLNKFNIKDKDFWLILTPILSLVILTTVFLLFLQDKWLQHFVALIFTVLVYYYFRYIYYFFCRITSYKPLTLESLSSYFNVISYFFISVSIYGLINFLNLHLWYLSLIIIAFTFLLSYQFFWINKVGERNNLVGSLIISILLIEFFWSISFFPISHFISGLALAIIYYIITNLSLLYFLEKLEKKAVHLYVTIGLVCLFVILLSAKWL